MLDSAETWIFIAQSRLQISNHRNAVEAIERSRTALQAAEKALGLLDSRIDRLMMTPKMEMVRGEIATLERRLGIDHDEPLK